MDARASQRVHNIVLIEMFDNAGGEALRAPASFFIFMVFHFHGRYTIAR